MSGSEITRARTANENAGTAAKRVSRMSQSDKATTDTSYRCYLRGLTSWKAEALRDLGRGLI